MAVTANHKVALVTGSAQRIGAEIVKQLHAAGFDVFIHYHTSIKQAQTLAATLNAIRTNSAHTIQQDLTEPAAVEDIMRQLQAKTDRLDVLVNNASIFKASPIQAASLADFEALFTLHVKVPYSLSLAAKTLLAKQQGLIINITDIHAQSGLPNYALYCQSKAALELQTKILAKELAPDIRVNAIAPGACLWPVGENQLADKAKQSVLNKIPLGSAGEPKHIALAVLSFVQNPYITGQILAVDGGRSLG